MRPAARFAPINKRSAPFLSDSQIDLILGPARSVGEEELGGGGDQDVVAVGCVGGPVGEQVDQLAGVALAVPEVGPVGAPEQPFRAGGYQRAAQRGDGGQWFVLGDAVGGGQFDPAVAGA